LLQIEIKYICVYVNFSLTSIRMSHIEHRRLACKQAEIRRELHKQKDAEVIQEADDLNGSDTDTIIKSITLNPTQPITIAKINGKLF